MSSSKADIYILSKNGGALFKLALHAVFKQRTPWPFGITVIDSGSTDGTQEFCRAQQIALHVIAPRDFQHGRTRNLAMSLGTGEYGVFLTQDAVPANDQWLVRLIEACELAPDVAGAFGRHLPYPGCNPYMARDLRAHFDQFSASPSVVRITDPQRYRTDIRYRQQMHFFSDCNACIRRGIWEHYRYPEVDFGEDQAWAERILIAGYAKAYADLACVYHSHELGIVDTLRRAYDEAAAYRRLFEYRLCPDIKTLALQAWRMTTGDTLYALRHGIWFRAPLWTGKIPWLNLARMTGYFFGQRSGQLPQWLQQLFSGDVAKRRAG